jgi:hypothetical protein
MSTIGVLGGRWRATVTASGEVEPWDGSPSLGWFIAADDRWHVPADEPTVRQRRIDGAPVLETRIKVPNGDAVHRVWCVADGGGFTVVEVENDSSLPFAVAFDRGDLLSNRPPTTMPIQGIDLPIDSIVLPVGHRATVRVALAHGGGAAGALPDHLSGAMQVARGWTSVIDAAGRMILPDVAVTDLVAQLRAELALRGPVEPGDDVAGFLIQVGQLVRLGERADPWVPDVAAAVAQAARLDPAWDVLAALDAAASVLARAGEARGLRDLSRMRPAVTTPLPSSPPAGRELVWYEQRLARATAPGAADLLAAGIPETWWGANFEVHDLPVAPSTTVSYAVRWHGDRPAVLWETNGPNVTLTASMVAPGWSTTDSAGEALWPPPASPRGSSSSADPAVGDPASSGDVSFS